MSKFNLSMAVQRSMSGKAPMHIDKEQLFSYFLYVYEYSFESSGLSQKENLEEFMDKEVRAFVPNYEELSLERQWWLFHMVANRAMLKETHLEYAFSTIDYLLGKFERIETDLLCYYVNEIQFILFNDRLTYLIPRPLELDHLNSFLVETDVVLRYFLDNQQKFMKVFKKHLRQKDCNSEFVFQVVIPNKKYNRLFSTYWDAVFESFISACLSMFEFMLPMQSANDFNEESLNQLYLNILATYFVNLIKDEEKLEPFLQDLLPLISSAHEIRMKDEDEVEVA